MDLELPDFILQLCVPSWGPRLQVLDFLAFLFRFHVEGFSDTVVTPVRG